MTDFDVDLDELRSVVAELMVCQRALLAICSEIEAEHAGLHEHWRGDASDAHATSYDSWRDNCAGMITALAALRGLGETAENNYRAAVEANLAMWKGICEVRASVT